MTSVVDLKFPAPHLSMCVVELCSTGVASGPGCIAPAATTAAATAGGVTGQIAEGNDLTATLANAELGSADAHQRPADLAQAA